ncbi:hypothetical protein EIL26_23055 [Salmonella enterica subsp. enterica serovar Newport]|nr:hypothetical protein [Salmonella enterica subsp. enterica serovar Newport]
MIKQEFRRSSGPDPDNAQGTGPTVHRDSGTTHGRRTTFNSRAGVRTALPALVLYSRLFTLTRTGKPQVAYMHKLLTTLC